MTFAPDGPQAAADKHRAAAVELVELADHSENSPEEELRMLRFASVHALLAIDARLANPVAPVEPGLCPSKVVSPRLLFERDGIWSGPEMTDEQKAAAFGRGAA